MDAFDTCLRLTRADSAVRRRVEAQGLSLTELAALHHLASEPDGTLRRQELAEHLGMTPSGITRSLAPLEKLGYVTREAHPRDARMSLVVLTPGGRERAQEALAVAREKAGALLERSLDADDVTALAGLLARLAP